MDHRKFCDPFMWVVLSYNESTDYGASRRSEWSIFGIKYNH